MVHRDQPLGLTVHSMPSPDEFDVVAQRTRSGRWKMILVLLICIAPVATSYFMYYVVRPPARSVFGTLIEPQRPLPDLVGTAPDGSQVNLRALRNQWLLVTVGGGACDVLCERHLYLQRQLRESLGKEKDRVDRVWLIDDAAPIPPALEPALRGATVLRVPQPALGQWLQPAQGHALSAHLYLVDPLGNWMMRFPSGLDMAGAAKAKRDLDRLLRASASWDKEGR